MNWQEVCEHPSLKDLPFKIELNELGQIVMTPIKVYHSVFQSEISQLLSELSPGTGITAVECAVKTEEGTKAADVAWISATRYKIVADETECSIAPEICVEVISASNTQQELDDKRALFISAGAREFWVCDRKRNMTFYDTEGKIEASRMIPKFPQQIKILD